jgi:hypothetical protein
MVPERRRSVQERNPQESHERSEVLEFVLDRCARETPSNVRRKGGHCAKALGALVADNMGLRSLAHHDIQMELQ